MNCPSPRDDALVKRDHFSQSPFDRDAENKHLHPIHPNLSIRTTSHSSFPSSSPNILVIMSLLSIDLVSITFHFLVNLRIRIPKLCLTHSDTQCSNNQYHRALYTLSH